jgi:hypothetical protein
MEEIIRLNVGGRHFVTTRQTLCAEAGSMLAVQFDLDGAIFIDRNPQTFEIVLDYFRNGCTVVSDIVPDERCR